MLRWFFRRKLNSEEKRLGASMDYLRHIVDVSPSAFLRFAAIMPFANSRKTLPPDAWFVAQLVALQQEDCGPCVQIGVNLAKESGVDPRVIRAALEADRAALSKELAAVFDFTRAVLATEDVDALRQTIRERYGEQGLIELAYAIAGSRVPPTVKRALGFATSCSTAPVDVN